MAPKDGSGSGGDDDDGASKSSSDSQANDAVRFAYVGELYARRCREEELILFSWGDANR